MESARAFGTRPAFPGNVVAEPIFSETAIRRWVCDLMENVQCERSGDNLFFFSGEDRRMPFATFVTDDSYDTASDLKRPGVYRLNLGIGKDAYRHYFGKTEEGTVWDHTALDRVLPHPVYHAWNWVCVLNPSESTLSSLGELFRAGQGLAGRLHVA